MWTLEAESGTINTTFRRPEGSAQALPHMRVARRGRRHGDQCSGMRDGGQSGAAEAGVCFKRLKEIVVPESVVEIGVSAFEDCRELKRAVLPGGLKHIGNGAFKNCHKRREINLPNNETME